MDSKQPADVHQAAKKHPLPHIFYAPVHEVFSKGLLVASPASPEDLP